MEQLKSMGFSFDSASKAARTAAGDAILAIELLTSGVCTDLRHPLVDNINIVFSVSTADVVAYWCVLGCNETEGCAFRPTQSCWYPRDNSPGGGG